MHQANQPIARRLAAICTIVGMAACGGSTPTTPVTPTPVPTPIPVTTVVNGGSFSNLDTNWDYWIPFTTATTGRIDLTVDWTLPADDVEVLVATGRHTCVSGEYWDFSACNVVATVHDGSKPKKVSLAAQAAGTFTLYILNNGPNTESVAWQVLLTTPG
jgi:hypothetical protein